MSAGGRGFVRRTVPRTTVPVREHQTLELPASSRYLAGRRVPRTTVFARVPRMLVKLRSIISLRERARDQSRKKPQVFGDSMRNAIFHRSVMLQLVLSPPLNVVVWVEF